MPLLPPFKLERYFARYEFKAPYLLSASDCESLSLAELLSMANPETTRLWDQLSLGYTDSAGHPELRAEIAGQYQLVSPEQVLVLAPEEGIFIAMHTLLSPGDEVIAISPAYQSLHEVARSLDCAVIPWQLQEGPEGWELDIDQLAQSLTRRTRLLVVNFPHNPTGYLPQVGLQDAVIDLARRNGLYVFSDEMYRMLEYDPARRLPAMCDRYERGISLSGLSKSYALPGLRIGWLATQDSSLVERWTIFKDYTTICSSAPSEILGIMALQAADQVVARNLEIIRQNLSQASHFFERWSGLFSWIPPQAGSVAFPEWKGPGGTYEFCEAVVDQSGVMIVPGSLFDRGGQHFRIGLGRRSFPTALQRVEGYLQAAHLI